MQPLKSTASILSLTWLAKEALVTSGSEVTWCLLLLWSHTASLNNIFTNKHNVSGKTPVSVWGLRKVELHLQLILKAHCWPLVVTFMLYFYMWGNHVWFVVLCFSATLPCSRQQPQQRERLETFEDVIRSSLEVTGRSVFAPGLVCEHRCVCCVCVCRAPPVMYVCVFRVLGSD